jgi:hypothetical protein
VGACGSGGKPLEAGKYLGPPTGPGCAVPKISDGGLAANGGGPRDLVAMARGSRAL